MTGRMKKKLYLPAAAAIILLSAIAGYFFYAPMTSPPDNSGPAAAQPSNQLPVVQLSTNYGDIVLELYPEKAPATVQNFVAYTKAGFYDNTVFHRVINGFMIQGGGFEPGMKQKQTRKPIKNEADNGLHNLRGTIAMARTSDPHSATSQFFINHKDNHFLNFKEKSAAGWGYAVFGKVTGGLDIVDKIAAVKTGSASGHQDVPNEDVVIEKAVVAE